jgi:SAM-dependent methyltransferase
MTGLPKMVLSALGLLDPARALRRQWERGARGVLRAVGVIPHHTSERRRYWEERGKVFFDQVRPIFTPEEPAYHAQQEFLDALGGIPWTSALEVGCGFGWHLRALRQRYPEKRIVGVDFSFSQLKRGLDYLSGSGVPLGQAHAGCLPFADETFDLVLTSGALIYVHAKALPGVLAELRRVARRALVLLEYAREHMDSSTRQALMDGADWHGHHYTKALSEAGLTLIRAVPCRAFEAHPDRVPFSLFHAEKS